MTRPFTRDEDDGFVVRLDAAEIRLLRALAAELRDLVETGDAQDPARVRLFPRAYLDPTEDAAETQWRLLAGADIVSERLDRLAALIDAADAADPGGSDADAVQFTLDADGTAAWLGVLNDARLTLGSRLELTGDDDVDRVPGNDARDALLALYDWLTYLQSELIEVLLDSG